MSTDTAVNLEHHAGEHARIAARLAGAEHPWLAELRRQALEEFLTRGLPGRRDEQWRYTRLTGVAQHAFRAVGDAVRPLTKLDADTARYTGLDCIEMVFANGRLLKPSTAMAALPEGLKLESLSAALKRGETSLRERLTPTAGSLYSSFIPWNTAFVGDGALIEVAPGARIERPIHLVFLTETHEADLITHPRILVSVGAGASVRILETYCGAAQAAYMSNTITQIDLAERARVEHYRVQNESRGAFHFGSIIINQERGSSSESHSVALGASLSRQDITVHLNAEEASTFLNGLYMVGDAQHADHHTVIEHRSPHTRSEENYRGVLNGRARGVFNGRVVVHPDAQGTDARQSNRNLLLSRDAEVDTKPELEIYADDVKCAHGATVGQLDEQALFYLRSRGVSEQTAKGLLTYAFADDVLERIGIPALKRHLESVVVGLVPESERLRDLL